MSYANSMAGENTRAEPPWECRSGLPSSCFNQPVIHLYTLSISSQIFLCLVGKQKHQGSAPSPFSSQWAFSWLFLRVRFSSTGKCVILIACLGRVHCVCIVCVCVRVAFGLLLCVLLFDCLFTFVLFVWFVLFCCAAVFLKAHDSTPFHLLLLLMLLVRNWYPLLVCK